MSLYAPEPILKALLGPTNTGKTHYAVERMLARSSGCIGLPLRLLAREVYDRIVAIKGAPACALITGEEKIVPPHASYFVCTVEAMPTTRKFALVAIDEVQLAAHPERGHIFTDRILNMRGTEETLFLGSDTIRPILADLVPKVRFESRERFSTLSFAGASKLRALPKRSVIVAFSTQDVYGLAEMMRRYRGGAAVVMGALSPRTRNAQAELYQSGEVDFLIATDAVGMGLNLDADHVAFASLRKFDGRRKRFLNPMEAAQIAGRAGRFRNDGTFGTTGSCIPMDEDLVGRIENHMFEPVRGVEWRNSKLDFGSVDALTDSLNKRAPHRRLRRTQRVVDEIALERLVQDTDIMDGAKSRAATQRLWEVCQIPDFRTMGIDTHVKLLYEIHRRLDDNYGNLPHAWLSRQVARLDHIDGTIDTLSQRLMQIRTWTYVSNKANWLEDVKHWRARTRAVEDRLSDALHERLIAKFVDRRTRALMKGLGARTLMDVKIDDQGEISAEGHNIGRLDGLKFIPDSDASGAEAKALQTTAAQVVGPEIDRRMMSMVGATHDIFVLTDTGRVKWGETEIAQLAPGKSLLHPAVNIIGGDLGQAALRDQLAARLNDFVQTEIRTKLAPLLNLESVMTSKDVLGDARGFSYRMFELNGLMPRKGHQAEIKALDGPVRADLRGAGIRFGEYYIYMIDLIKPAASRLLSILTAFGKDGDGKPFSPANGATSVAMDKSYSEASLNAAGYSARGSRIVRVDILNRLGDTIRQAKAETKSARFFISLDMLSMLGCGFEECKDVLRALGYTSAPAKAPPPQNEQEASPAAAKPVKTATTLDEGQAPAHDDFDTANAALSIEPVGRKPALDSAPQENVATDIVTPAAPNTIGSDGKAKHAMPTAPKPKKKKYRKGTQPLVYFRPVTSQDEEGNDIREDQTEVWFTPYKRPQRNFSKKQSNAQSGGKPNRGANPKGPRKGNDARKPREDKFKSKRPVMRPEDSPFAALAALKSPKKD